LSLLLSRLLIVVTDTTDILGVDEAIVIVSHAQDLTA